jgi:hypothetical protein
MAESSTQKTYGCLLVIIMLPFIVALRGFILSKMWFYFLVPLGMTQIGLAHALGLSTLLSLFSGDYARSNGPDKDAESLDFIWVMVKSGVLSPLFLWFMGWCFYCFMQ